MHNEQGHGASRGATRRYGAYLILRCSQTILIAHVFGEGNIISNVGLQLCLVGGIEGQKAVALNGLQHPNTASRVSDLGSTESVHDAAQGSIASMTQNR